MSHMSQTGDAYAPGPFPDGRARVALMGRRVPVMGPVRTLVRSAEAAPAWNPKGGQMSAFFAAINVGDSVQTGLDAFFGFLPRLLGFLVILAIGWVVAKVVEGIVSKLLAKVGVDRALHS